MRMPARALLLAAAAGLLAACGGGGGGAAPVPPPPGPPPAASEEAPVSEVDFARSVAASLGDVEGVEVEATAGGDILVRQGLDSLELDLEGPYARYAAEPGRREAIEAEVVAVATARLERRLADLSLEEARPYLMPLLEPPFSLRGLPAEPLSRPFAGGLRVVYVIDRGHSRFLVTPADAGRWGLGIDDVDRVAQANLVANTEELLCEEELCGWASGDGYDATRLISAKLRRDIAEEIGEAVYAVPLENVFVALPVRLADRIRGKVLEQFTTGDKPVSKDVFVERDGRVVVLPPA
jgi:hypothetical protein